MEGGRVSLTSPLGLRQATCLFEPYPKATWALYSFLLDSEDEELDDGILVSAELAKILDGAMKYPPALALARETAFQVSPGNVDRKAYLQRIAGLMSDYLDRSQDLNFFLARAKASHGDVFVGSYHWIVGYCDEGCQVEFITDEYYILSAPVSCFEIRPQQLDKLGKSTN